MKYSTYNGFLCIEEIDRDFLNIDKTLDCGQCFRWNRLNDGTWLGVVNNKQFMVKHKEIDNVPCIITTATKEEWETILIDYFDFGTDYTKLTIPADDTFANQAYKDGKGIRILNQDPWEMVVSFIISQRNNIPKIKSTIHKLCEAYGDKIELEVNGRVYTDYTFPSCKELSQLDVSDLDGIGLGYRDEYIIQAARTIETNFIDLEKLTSDKVDGESTVNELIQMRGVGPKVANCIALFGLHKLDMFPIDIWMQRMITTYYNGSLDPSVYGSLAGLMQQYMFYHVRFV